MKIVAVILKVVITETELVRIRYKISLVGMNAYLLAQTESLLKRNQELVR